MFGWFKKSPNKKTHNTLDLQGDGDELDLVHALEKAVGHSFADNDVFAVETLGDLYALAQREAEKNTDFDPRALCFKYEAHSGEEFPKGSSLRLTT